MTPEFDQTAFWSVVATTAPVLGLALVLEARWLIAHGESNGFPRAYVQFSSVLNGVALFNLGLNEVNALTALVPFGDDTPLSRWSAVWALGLATVLVMVAPALGMFRFGMARGYARLATTWPRLWVWWMFLPLRWKRWRAARDRDRLLGQQVRLGRVLASHEDDHEVTDEVRDLYLGVEVSLWRTLAALDTIDAAWPRFARRLLVAERRLSERYREDGLRATRALAARLPV